ncbi:peptidoglycan DD-metalloendopeptidase family protein [Streptomyces sp. URMC 123]|uniref:peptidoglycan DD-metalloendopeptidase family protein n=1 Tax=Streptomyces sp. URMC 123 TaxID=3423403 RepID=UPI003F1B9B0E
MRSPHGCQRRHRRPGPALLPLSLAVVLVLGVQGPAAATDGSGGGGPEALAGPQRLAGLSAEVSRLHQEAGRVAQNYERVRRSARTERARVQRLEALLDRERRTLARVRTEAGRLARAQYRSGGSLAFAARTLIGHGGRHGAQGLRAAHRVDLSVVRTLREADRGRARLSAQERAAVRAWEDLAERNRRLEWTKRGLERELTEARDRLQRHAERVSASGHCTGPQGSPLAVPGPSYGPRMASGQGRQGQGRISVVSAPGPDGSVPPPASGPGPGSGSVSGAAPSPASSSSASPPPSSSGVPGASSPPASAPAPSGSPASPVPAARGTGTGISGDSGTSGAPGGQDATVGSGGAAGPAEVRLRRAGRRWVPPVESYVLSAGFASAGAHWAHRHTGQDFAVPIGTPVRAVGAGRVHSITCGDAFGISLIVAHGDGHYSQYAHLASLYVRAGQPVAAGQRIALSGDTGNSTGPHLHFEIRRTPELASAVDPVAWLRERGVRLTATAGPPPPESVR